MRATAQAEEVERERDDRADKETLDRIIPNRLNATARTRNSVVEGLGQRVSPCPRAPLCELGKVCISRLVAAQEATQREPVH